MARRYRRRRYFKKAKWCPNLQDIINSNITANYGRFSATTTLTTNPNNSSSTVSQIYTVKNVEISFTVEGGNPTLDGITAFIMFVPQGMNIAEDYHKLHPEYIMAYKYLGNPVNPTNASGGQQFQPIRVRSRLSRKLNTGDSIILYITGLNTNQNSTTFSLSGLVRWWTKAN